MPSNDWGGARTDPFALQTTRAESAGRIRQNVAAFIEKEPIWLVYVRTAPAFPCMTCRDYATGSVTEGEGTAGCFDCFGLGFEVTLERHPTRFAVKGDAGGDPLSGGGFLASYPVTIDVPAAYRPKVEDLYLDVAWNVAPGLVPARGVPTAILHAYRLGMAPQIRQSEVSYYGCGAAVHDVDHAFLVRCLSRVYRQKGFSR